ncbi:MAG: MATE family efflux transporter [Lachnospiraceae bacterium]|nr:MATE family efflux transporter [Lachnospiraceae bacterium]
MDEQSLNGVGADAKAAAADAAKEARRAMMLDGPLTRTILVIALPMVFSMLVDSIYNMTDTYFVSQLGITATAAVGINDSVLNYIRAIAMGLGTGTASILSRMLGAERVDEANRLGTTALIAGIGFLTCVAAVAFIFIDPLVVLLGATPTVKPYSLDYARFILLGTPFTAGEVIGGYLHRSEGNTRLAMVGTVSGCVVNVALDPILITVCGLGVAGAAIATTIAKVISFSILMFPFITRRTMLQIRLRYFKPTMDMFWEVMQMGLPTFLRSFLMHTAFVVLNNVAGHYSDVALAAVSISRKSLGFVSSAIMGFGMGFQPLAGFCWGAKRYTRVRKAFWKCSMIGWVAVAVIGVVMSFMSKYLIGIFTNSKDPEIIRLGSLMLVSSLLCMMPHVWSVVINGLAMALGKPIQSALLGTTRSFIALVPCILIFSHFFGVNGLAVSQAAADVLSLVIVIPVAMSLLGQIHQAEKEVGHVERHPDKGLRHLSRRD